MSNIVQFPGPESGLNLSADGKDLATLALAFAVKKGIDCPKVDQAYSIHWRKIGDEYHMTIIFKGPPS